MSLETAPAAQEVHSPAVSQQSPPADTINVGATPTQEDSSSHVSITNEEYVKFNAWIADSKKRNVSDILKDMKGNVGIRRQTMVLRRVDQEAIAPDEDVAAYQKIYDMKNPAGDSKNKTFVSDNEINAYKELDPRFDNTPSLSDITAKVKEMKKNGHLSVEGDKVSGEDE